MGRRKPARSQEDKDKDYISEMEMCEPQDEDYDDEEINQHTANIMKRSNEGHEENADRENRQLKNLHSKFGQRYF
ncbi:Hypothetical predicted protein [Mytilus galloprovincialis]|uniref:Uncharacterized protein n=1 Tax=Mytilus galloprovincialis TaxID=29158 RepID=A0A8B6FAT1_MYTGA|nr:Hypothetical predicted protein [Mytilus galloprovincialis]